MKTLTQIVKEDNTNASYFDLFRTPNLRKRTLIIYFHWLK